MPYEMTAAGSLIFVFFVLFVVNISQPKKILGELP